MTEDPQVISQELIERILDTKGIIMIIGQSDTGKTYLAKYLLKKSVEKGIVTGFVDSDIGQSTIGPPATIGMKIIKNRFPENIEKTKPQYMRFVGSTSPVGHLLQTLTGVKKMVDQASKSKTELIVVDTTGLVKGGIGRELKYNKIELISPNYLIALEKKKELEHIIKLFKYKKNLMMYRTKPSEKVEIKNNKNREKNRENKFKSYFKNSNTKYLGLNSYGVHGNTIRMEKNKLKNILIALCDSSQNVVDLGIIKKYFKRENKLKVYTPLKSLKKVRSIQFGSIAISTEGKQSESGPG
ncbi:MAG: Clp1/GlmU family protein [Atribacterota bacterium]